MYKESKPMLTPSELIKHLESKGVKFELINKEDAQNIQKKTTIILSWYHIERIFLNMRREKIVENIQIQTLKC